MIIRKPLRIIEDTGALKQGHFVLTSGLHTENYINKDAIYLHPDEIASLAKCIAYEYRDAGIEAVLGPAMGGVILSQWVAFHLSRMTKRDVLAVYADKDETGRGFVMKRGYDRAIIGKRILIVEDVINTGGSVKKAVDLARENGCKVVGVGALCNRGGATHEKVGHPGKLTSVIDIKFETWTEDECPLCKKHVHINTDVGKGQEFLDKRRKDKK